MFADNDAFFQKSKRAILAKAKAPFSRTISLFFPNVKTFPEYHMYKTHAEK